MKQRNLLVGVALVVVVGMLFLAQDMLQTAADAQSTGEAPRFEVDPFWPKPLPENWRLGSAIGVDVDHQDLVWIVHRSSATLANEERAAELDPPQGECCVGAPPILAFDQDGNVVHAWGPPPGYEGEGFTWPESNHGIHVDEMGFVWIGGNGASDSHILKFTSDGNFVAQYGEPGARIDATGEVVANSLDTRSFGQVTKVWTDPEADEVYVGDGYLNRRVAVLDRQTGEMLRFWGAYGNVPDDSYEHAPQGMDDQRKPPQFRSPVHCAMPSNDGLVYVCDRAGDRIQVFTRDGTFVQEQFYAPRTLRSGSAWDLAFSPDPEQRFLYLVDGVNEKVRIIERGTLAEVTNFGAGGRQPGQFFGVHSIATDSRGNVYTTETYEGKRVQRFLNRGMAPVRDRDQGTPWPAEAR